MYKLYIYISRHQGLDYGSYGSCSGFDGSLSRPVHPGPGCPRMLLLTAKDVVSITSAFVEPGSHLCAPTSSGKHFRGQTTVENCIGGHVNVLSDYKKT